MPTISDVAKLAGVSVATVSRVINQKGNVLPKAEEAVRKAIAELNYSPNSIGRNLRQLKTNRILVLQPSIINPFYSHVVRGIDAAAHQAGYHIMLSDTNSDPERERQYLEMLESHVADGAILTTPCHLPEYYREFASRYPMVFCTEDYGDSPISSVTMDNVAAALDATRYLINLGHTKIAFLCVYGNRHTVAQRLKGYQLAMQEAGLAIRPEFFVEATAERDDLAAGVAQNIVRKFTALPDMPTAIFCTSDLIGMGAIRGLRECGFSVPEDISVFSFDDIDAAKLYDPMLSTVYIPKYKMGSKAVELLLERIQNPECKPRRELVQHEIRARESTRALNAGK
ncbi:MAG: LacI family DNA-binding transcriptional regulator [bacterium]|nr:LacI family DNA-binding transcriptional regulator [bacterium]